MTKAQKIKAIRLAFSILGVIILGVADLPDNVFLKIGIYMIPYLAAGYDVLYSAARNILNGQIFDEQFLMALATVGAFVIGEYPEAVMVMTFFGVGELFEKLAVGKSRKSITELMNIVPEYANLVRGQNVEEVSPDEVSKGDIILVRPGERIPLDGVITQGETFVDTSALTGEPVPKKAGVGDNVISGCINGEGLIYVRVENEFYESTATKILELVESSTMKKARTEAFITKFARYYTPIVVIGAVLISVIASVITGQIFESVRRGLVFLVVSCPCALVISVPLSFFGGIGGASKKGILIKGSEFIEALSKTDVVLFDKTGTLTEGRFKVKEIYTEGITRNEFLEYSAAVEAYSTHPVAKCLIQTYGKPLDLSQIQDMTEHRGGGVFARYHGKDILVGNIRLMNEKGVKVDKISQSAENTVYMAVNGVFAGYAVLGDSEKTGSRKALSELRSLGVTKTVMLTGDVKAVAEQIGHELSVDEVYAELLPVDKVSVCEKLLDEKKRGRTLVFAGDGINDAPVLSRADVGIAMGAMGSDAAIEASDVVLMDDDPRKVAEAIRISRKTMMIVRQNIIFALSVKGIVLVLGALGFANMWLAVFADVGVSVIAIMNAMRALKINSKIN